MDGLRVGVTAGRKGAELATALERRGALPLLGPTVGGDQPEPEDVLLAQTALVVEAEPDWLVASTGVGVRLWAETAERHGQLEELRRVASEARRLARGAKAVGGLTGALGLSPEWVATSETDAEVADHLAARTRPGETVAVQLHGGHSRAYDGLADLGVEVLAVLPYRSVLPQDTAPARRLVRALIDGALDLLVFTSPGAVHNLLTIAGEVDGTAPDRVRQMVGAHTAVAAVGPVTAGACAQAGLEVTLTPTRSRTGDLLRSIEAWSSAPAPD